MQRTLGRCGAFGLLVVALAACGSSASPHTTPPSSTSTATSTTSSTTTSTVTESTTTTTAPAASPPLVTAPRGRITFPTTTTMIAAASAFRAAVTNVTAAELGASYHAGCPVGPDQLRRVRLTYWGFDGQSHTGNLIVNVNAVDAVSGA